MYTEIWKPFEIKGITLQNRIVLPPMATESSTEDGSVSEQTINHYKKIAGSGVGLLIVEHHYIDKMGQFSPHQLSIGKDANLPEERLLVLTIHHAGVPCALQINHAGSNRLNSMGHESVGVSAIPHPTSKITPAELQTNEIHEIIRMFGSSAKRAKECCYDMVEIHSAHGYLSSQFLSPLTNHRKDKYGGSILNRMRFLIEVVEEVKSMVGDDYPLLVRLGVSDNPPGIMLHPDGLTLEDSLQVTKELVNQKIDILDISGGMCGSRPASVEGEAYYLPFSEYLKPKIKIPTIYTAGVTSLETAERIRKDDLADLIGIGRKLIATPDLIKKELKSEK